MTKIPPKNYFCTEECPWTYLIGATYYNNVSRQNAYGQNDCEKNVYEQNALKHNNYGLNACRQNV